MKKKYKLIKEYPGSLKLGYIIEQINNGKNSEDNYYTNCNWVIPSKFPEFWEEIIEKEYEILKFSDGFNIYCKMFSGLFTINTTYTYDEEYLLKCQYKIYSVKRLSDGKIFTIGDKVCWDWTECNVKYFVIDALRLSFDKSEIILEFEKRNVFEGLFNDEKFNFRHYEESQPLFTTEDGVEIFEKDSYFLVTNDFKKAFCSFYSESDLKYKLFSDGEKADEYIKMNKPEFSRKQVIELVNSLSRVANTISIRYNLIKKENGNN